MARLYTRRESRSRALTFRIFGGMFDYIVTVFSAVIIIVCVVLMIQLIKWIISDFDLSFGSMLEMFREAVVID